MHDPMTQIYHCGLFTLWHVDPERGPGGDDSCGWFKRAHHGDEAVLAKIVKRFEEDWDRVFNYREENHHGEPAGPIKKTYFCGFFYPEDAGSGMPNMGVTAIVLNLFFLAAGEHFESTGHTNWKRARKWMQANLFDIMLFAENPTDSMRDAVVRKFGCDTRREDRIRGAAATIYGWILRREQKWWQHPRWHVHHWRLQIQPLNDFKRWAFSRCCKCGRSFRFGASVCTNNWNSTGPMWFRGEKDIYHDDCDNPSSSARAAKSCS